jgi:hypothetical protein
MSHIPNSAMPHAGPTQNEEEQGSTLSQAASSAMESASGFADTVMEKVRSAPRSAVAAGAAVAVGALAAAAIPLVKGALADGKKSGGSKSGSKSSGAKKKA